MLAPQHGIVTPQRQVEVRVPVIRPVAVAMRDVELLLDLPAVAPVRPVPVRARLLPEEIRRHVLHRIEAESVAAGRVHHVARRAIQIGIHVLGHGIPHVVAPVAEAPHHRPPARIRGIDAAVGEGFAGLADIVLPVSVGVVPVEPPIPHPVRRRPPAGVLPGLLVREGEHGIAVPVRRHGQVGVRIIPAHPRLPDAAPFRIGLPLGAPVGIEAHVGILLRDVPRERVAVQHLPLVVPVDRVRRLRPLTVAPDKVKVLRHEARCSRKQLPGQRRRIQRPAVVRHDVVEIYPDPEPVRLLHQRQQFRPRAIPRPHRSRLVLVPEIKPVERIITHREAAARPLARRRQPERRIPRLRYLRQPLRNLRPRRVEILQHGLVLRPHRNGRS